MGLFDFIGPASGLLFTLENIIWINLGVFIGCVFAAIPGLSVILCIILFLPVTYTMKAIPGMMFLLGIYCAGGYGGSVSAILINTPGTPHAAATMLDGHPLSKMGRTKAALKIALYASTFGGIFSALVLLFLGPQVAKISAQLGTAEYFMVCLFGMTIIAGVSGKSLVKGIIAACLGLLISCVGADPMTSYDRFTFGVHRLYLGLDLAVTLIGLFALVEIIGKAELKRSELNLHAGKIGNDDGKITKDEYKRMLRPVLIGSLIGSCVGIVPGTGASEASWFSYNTAKNMSKHPEEFGHGSVEGVAAAESANNAVCGHPPADAGHPRRRLRGHYAVRSDDQRPEPRPLALYHGWCDHVRHHAGSYPCEHLHVPAGQVPDQPVCKGRLHPPADPDPYHRHLLLCRCLLGEQQLFRPERCAGVRRDGVVHAQAGTARCPCAVGYGAGQHDGDQFPPRPAHLGRKPQHLLRQRVLLDLHCADRGGHSRHSARQDEGSKEHQSRTVKGGKTMAYNIIFYFSDQQRWDTCGCFGQPLNITPNLDKLAAEGVKFDNAFSPQPVCGPCRALFQTGKYPTETGCFRNNLMLPSNIKTLGEYMEKDAGYETAYIGKWHLASDGELEKKPTVDHTITAVPLELRGGYTGYWRAADVLEFTSHGYDGYVFDENNNRIDFKGYRADCINQFALDYLDQYAGEKPFFMTVSQIEPHHQNDHNHYEGPNGSKQRFADFVLPEDLKALGGNAAEEYPDYLGQCASLDENLGKLVSKLKEKGLYDNTVILYASDHGSHFKTRNRDAHLNGYDDYKRSCHDGCLHVPLVICGGPFKGGKEITDLVSTESIPKTLLALAGVDVGDKMIGENLLDVVEKKNHNRVNEVYAQISESRCGRCIRTADYMYSVYAPGVNGGEAAASDVYADDFLYDMQKDPWQLNNVVADPAYAAVKAELRERLLNWIQHAEGSRPTITD